MTPKELHAVARTYPLYNNHYHYDYYLIKFQYYIDGVTLRTLPFQER
jgi:hypothetical protein